VQAIPSPSATQTPSTQALHGSHRTVAQGPASVFPASPGPASIRPARARCPRPCPVGSHLRSSGRRSRVGRAPADLNSPKSSISAQPLDATSQIARAPQAHQKATIKVSPRHGDHRDPVSTVRSRRARGRVPIVFERRVAPGPIRAGLIEVGVGRVRDQARDQRAGAARHSRAEKDPGRHAGSASASTCFRGSLADLHRLDVVGLGLGTGRLGARLLRAMALSLAQAPEPALGRGRSSASVSGRHARWRRPPRRSAGRARDRHA
jgi:hypothetical protein